MQNELKMAISQNDQNKQKNLNGLKLNRKWVFNGFRKKLSFFIIWPWKSSEVTVQRSLVADGLGSTSGPVRGFPRKLFLVTYQNLNLNLAQPVQPQLFHPQPKN